MIEGWFNAFREFGGPTWYGDHRTPVVIDFTIAKIVVIFSVFLTTFLIIFPGVRRRKWSSFPTTVHSLFIGASILIAHFYPCWHQAEVALFAPYRAFSSERVLGVLGIQIGLSSANITLHGTTDSNKHDPMNYNERIYFTDVKTMHQNFVDALQKGLPYPIITVIEYIAVEKAGFVWGRGYRLAGYYTDFLLWISFSLWCISVLMICALPRFFSRTQIATGCCLFMAVVVYAIACPKNLCIPFPTHLDLYTRMTLHFGWCFWLILIAGASCLLIGIAIRSAEVNYSCEFKTFLQSDYEAMSNTTSSSKEDQCYAEVNFSGTVSSNGWHSENDAIIRTTSLHNNSTSEATQIFKANSEFHIASSDQKVPFHNGITQNEAINNYAEDDAEENGKSVHRF